MAYPYLPVNPCCTDVVLNSPCGCSSTITNGGCNNPCGTHLTASSTIVYDGPALSCTTAEPCDTLNVILQKIDEIICNLLTQINILNIEIINIKNEITNINNNITNIYNILGECCTTTTSTTAVPTTTSTTTIRLCENFSLTNTGDVPVAIIITDCTTQEPDAIILYPGDTNICVVTDSPLTVPGTIIVIPNGPCFPPTTSTTSSTSTSTTTIAPTTTTTTTPIPCECLTFENTDSSASHNILYNNCLGEPIDFTIAANQTSQFCGCCASADSDLVLITVGADCIGGLCPGITTTTTTTAIPNCNFTGTANQLPDPTTTTTSSSSSTTTSTTTAAPTTTTTTTVCVNCIPGNVTIGTQVWTGCNLNITTFANGDPIPEVSDPTAWAALTTPAWCYYNNDPTNNLSYGKLYNWYAVNDPRGLAPTGYHVPSDAEWTTLTTFLGGLSVAGGPLKQTGTCSWNSPNTDATNSSGFSALAGGVRDSFGAFSNFGFNGNYWSSSLIPSTDYYYRQLHSFDGIVNRNYGNLEKLGFSVRVLQD